MVAHICKHNKQFLKHNRISLKHKSIFVKHNTKLSKHNTKLSKHSTKLLKHNTNLSKHNTKLLKHNYQCRIDVLLFLVQSALLGWLWGLPAAKELRRYGAMALWRYGYGARCKL